MADNVNTLIIKALAQLAKNKGGRRNMSSVLEIKNIIKDRKNKIMSSNEVESVLDVLIQAKYVRYQKRIYHDKEYQWYGLTRSGWTMLSELMKTQKPTAKK
jgi:hypothetical protein